MFNKPLNELTQDEQKKVILEEVNNWMQSKDAQRIQDLQRPVTIVKRHDSSHTSYRKLSLVDAIGRIVLLDYVFCEKKGKEFMYWVVASSNNPCREIYLDTCL